MDTLGGVDAELAGDASQLLNLIGPNAGGVDENVAADSGGRASVGVKELRADDALAFLHEVDNLGGGADVSAEVSSGAQDSHGVTGIVNQSVVVANAADHGIFLQARSLLQGSLAGVVLLHRNLLGATHDVVKEEARCHERTLPYAVSQREDEAQWLNQVRCQMRHGQFALAQGFSYQAEVQHLQVAQTAVEHL